MLSKTGVHRRRGILQNRIVVRAGGILIFSQSGAAATATPCGADAGRIDLEWLRPRTATTALVRKEVIQPQVPLRLPCYDFAPVTGHTMGDYLPCGLVCRLPVQQTSMA
jgi:hypothetical protein